MTVELHVACLDDCTAIQALIETSARALGRGDYTPEEIDAALEGVWGLDTQLVKDGTYYLAKIDNRLAGCGGWSYRATLFGSDAEGSRDAEPLDPATDPARIRAFFVHPEFARRGVGSVIMRQCEAQARAAGFRALTLGATLPGQRLYLQHGFTADMPVDYELRDGLVIQIIPMHKRLDATS